MAELTTIARPYAKAAFQFALESNALAEWSKTLAQLALIVCDETVKAFLSRPNLSPEQKIDALVSVAEEPVSEPVKNLLQQLAKYKRLAALPQIFVLFDSLQAEHLKTADVSVSSAFALSKAELESLKVSLAKRLGRQVNLESTVDKSLIGGVVIHAGDLVIDASVKGKLAKLKNVLNT
jgi:F-type H+-transporting ATPase subunit delta